MNEPVTHMDKKNSSGSSDRTDRIYRNTMLGTGILTALLFLLSLISLVEFPGAFGALAIGMIGCAIAFLLLRTIYRYRNTFRVRK